MKLIKIKKSKSQSMSQCIHFCAPLKSALSFGVSPTSIIFAPASNCIIRPEVTMGDIPNSIRVPLFEANITRIQ